MKSKLSAWARVLGFILMITFIPVLSCPMGFATQAPDMNYQATASKLLALKQQPGITETYGEIISITSVSLMLRSHGVLQYYPVSPRAALFCNGNPAVWNALTPVTQESFFEAKVLMNQNLEVIAIDGYYYGEPCLIKDWRLRDGRIQSLKIFSPGSHTTRWRIVLEQKTAPASFPPDTSWLELEREIFVLYNWKGEIRGIFLPEGY